MKLYIPMLGDELILSKDWEFLLFDESRNESLFTYLGRKETPADSTYWTKFRVWAFFTETGQLPSYRQEEFGKAPPADPIEAGAAIRAKLPAGTTLIVDRIYIRKGADDFSSITFRAKGLRTEPKVRKAQRWVHRFETVPASEFLVDPTIKCTGPKKIIEEYVEYDLKIPAKPVRFWVKLNDANNIEFNQ